ncbi:hypothetical protein BHM03_00023995 [Ensete ventricosum]|nr:hypothetical protein BHM03_00023995 [Ensete ventricosum]
MAEELIWFGFSHVCKFVNVDHNWGVRLSSGLRLENLNLRSVTWAPLPQVHSEVLYEGLVGVGVPDVTLSTLKRVAGHTLVLTSADMPGKVDTSGRSLSVRPKWHKGAVCHPLLMSLSAASAVVAAKSSLYHLSSALRQLG